MSLRIMTSYSRALALVIIIAAASAAPHSFAIMAFSGMTWMMRRFDAALLQQLEGVAKTRRVRAVFLTLGPDIDHHVDAVARRHHLDLVCRIAGIGNAIDAGLAGDGR